MAENDTTKTDIFKQQEQTIVMLQDVLRKQAEEEAGPPQIIYAQQPELVRKPPNYLLYIALGVIALILFKK